MQVIQHQNKEFKLNAEVNPPNRAIQDLLIYQNIAPKADPDPPTMMTWPVGTINDKELDKQTNSPMKRENEKC
jgi:hypothetical protein